MSEGTRTPRGVRSGPTGSNPVSWRKLTPIKHFPGWNGRPGTANVPTTLLAVSAGMGGAPRAVWGGKGLSRGWLWLSVEVVTVGFGWGLVLRVGVCCRWGGSVHAEQGWAVGEVDVGVGVVAVAGE